MAAKKSPKAGGKSAQKTAARKAARKTVRISNRYSTAGEGYGLVKTLTSGKSRVSLADIRQTVRAERGSAAAKRAVASARILKKSVGGSGSQAARKAAKKTANKLRNS